MCHRFDRDDTGDWCLFSDIDGIITFRKTSQVDECPKKQVFCKTCQIDVHPTMKQGAGQLMCPVCSKDVRWISKNDMDIIYKDLG